MAVKKFKLTLEYRGDRFSGWAAQPGRRTVEGELTSAIAEILDEDVKLEVAGRTDAGVHAWGQVASFGAATELEPERLAGALNATLDNDVAVLRAEHAAAGFSARRNARSRTYCYRVFTRATQSPFERGCSLWWPHRCDFDVLASCAKLVVGKHDFTAFTPTQTHHSRFECGVEAAEWREDPDRHLREFWIEGQSFLQQMVRALVGTMLEVGTGRISVDEFAALLHGAARERGGPTAAAAGLYLAAVRY